MADAPEHQHAAKHPGQGDEEAVRYPENRVVGILDTVDELTATIDALTTGGFLPSEVEVLCGQAAARRLHENTGRTGLANIAMRLAAGLGLADDEMAVKDHYEHALRDGHFLVAVLAQTDERKDLAARILHEHGARFVNFLGRFTIEAMVPPAGG